MNASFSDIRAAAFGESTRLGELRAMKRATERLQDEAKAAMRGGIKTESADRIFARFQFTSDSVQEEINGPPRQSERRAKADLAKLLQAPSRSRGQILYVYWFHKYTF